MSKQTYFQDDWLLEPNFISWLERVPLYNKRAYCKFCHKTFELSNMGRRAITSHMDTKKHKKLVAASRNSVTLKFPLQNIESSVSLGKDENCADPHSNSDTTCSNASNSTAFDPLCPPRTSTDTQSPAASDPLCPPSTSTDLYPNASALSRPKGQGIKSYLLNDSVTKAEILWTIESVMTHTSLRTAGRDVLLFSCMFPDSEIAKKMQLQRDKIGYLLAYGLSPFFQEELLKILNACEFFTVGFDESLNKVAQKQQMDLNVRFWDEEKDEVSTRYLTSVFLGRSRAVDLLNAFEDGLKDVNMKNILQISLDGPNVNLRFLKDLKSDLNTTDPTARKILDFGTCGLHTLHGAFKTAMQGTGWEIVPFLRALYNLFKDSPSRRALFTSISESSIFPKKFCAVRWLHNADVAQRAIELIPNLKLFVEEAKKTKAITSKSFETVSQAVFDPLITAKLEFFRGLASDVEPFLKEFQSDEPLAPFLYEELSAIIKIQLTRIAKPGVVEKVSSFKDMKIPEKDLLSAGEINLGIATKHAITKANKSSGKLPNSLIHEFRQNCKNSIIKFISKVIEKSPLNLRLTKSISCLDPKTASNEKVRKIRMESLLSILLDANWVSSSVVDQVMREFENVCKKPSVIAAMNDYERTTRIDAFWMKHLNEKDHHLRRVIKIVCCLSHGNSNAERGFSINKECVVENMREELLVARRVVYDKVLSIGGIQNVIIEKSMIHAARNSYSRYVEAAKEKKKKQEELAANNKRKRDAESEKKELEKKRLKILEEAQKQADLINEEIKQLSHI